VCFTSNSRFLLTSNLDSTLRLLEISQRKRTRTFRGHVNTRFCCAPALLAPVGRLRFVVGGGDDGEVAVWGLQSSKLKQRFKAHEDAVMGVSAHPSAFLFATASKDATVRLWQAPPPEEQPQQQPQQQPTASAKQ
jgi:COMPASS component SWD3